MGGSGWGPRGEAERNRLANALAESNDTAASFIDAVCQTINTGPAAALAVVLIAKLLNSSDLCGEASRSSKGKLTPPRTNTRTT